MPSERVTLFKPKLKIWILNVASWTVLGFSFTPTGEGLMIPGQNNFINIYGKSICSIIGRCEEKELLIELNE